ncbi:hypothetical protein [Spongiactinospora sp. 9N601]|uniref:hypothetical protein n=1 Tax=Spongiactinospora sp. 9N601 TaxID=3375149 RepID=UPI0037C78043
MPRDLAITAHALARCFRWIRSAIGRSRPRRTAPDGPPHSSRHGPDGEAPVPDPGRGDGDLPGKPGRASLKRLRLRCEARLDALTLPTPFDVRVLCATLAEERGRPIHLLPMTGNPGVQGLWVATETADVIFYEDATTPPHQEHIILHELSHLLCDHYRVTDPAAELARALLPDLDPGMVVRMLGRTSYTAIEEQEAELLATLIQQRARRPRRGVRPGSLARRLMTALDWSSGGPPARPF